MELVNDFEVNVPIDEAWATLTDVEKIAPCLPGAQLQEIEGDVYRGVVKIKVGPITAQFKGQATFQEKDAVAHKAVLKAEGRDTGGKGNASALITLQLTPQGPSSTKASVTTDLTITGKVAQFGRGALVDVSSKLLSQFVDQLHDKVLHPTDDVAPADVAPADVAPAEAPTDQAPTDQASGAEAAVASDPPAIKIVSHAATEPVDLLSAAGAPLAKRLIPLVAGLIVVLLVLRRLRRRHQSAD